MNGQKRQRALVSVTDKRNLIEFAGLAANGWEIISTGGTAKSLEALSIPVTPVERVTMFPEMLGGRLKTLHPNIFGGILGRRENPDDMAALAEYNIDLIDVVAVNLYNFAGKPDIEQIDIGGPSLIRAAAKNSTSTVPLIDPDDYASTIAELLATGTLTMDRREYLVMKVFKKTAAYDQAILEWMLRKKAEYETFLAPAATD